MSSFSCLQHFSSRSYHRFLTVIVHLQEVQVTVAKENYKYGLLEQVPFSSFRSVLTFTMITKYHKLFHFFLQISIFVKFFNSTGSFCRWLFLWNSSIVIQEQPKSMDDVFIIHTKWMLCDFCCRRGPLSRRLQTITAIPQPSSSPCLTDLRPLRCWNS